MERLGFTFYPKDWWTSDTYFELDPIERYIYLECLFIMYANDGFLKTELDLLKNRIRVEIKPNQWKRITEHFILTELGYTSASLRGGMQRSVTNRLNGVKGGRPKTKSTTDKEPKHNRNGLPSEKNRIEKNINKDIVSDPPNDAPKVASSDGNFSKDFSEEIGGEKPLNSEKEKKDTAAEKKKKKKVLLLAGLKKLPVDSKNRYVNAAIYFYSLLAPFHKDKHTFAVADANKWAANLRTLETSHGRKLENVFEVVEWALENTTNTRIYMQSPFFLVRDSGANYDRLMERMKVEKENADKKNGAVKNIDTPEYFTPEMAEKNRVKRHLDNDIRIKKLKENGSI